MKHDIPHDLPLELAIRANRRALAHYAAEFPQYEPKADWVEEDHARLSFSVMGRTLVGDVRVRADRVELSLDLPLAFRPFRRAALDVVEREIAEWIEKARRGELDD